MDLIELQREFIGRVESASGKPVIMQCDPTFAGHATIRIARDDQPAHLLLHKTEHDAVLPYLVAFQCLVALRTIEADKESKFDLASKPNMAGDVLKLTTKHAKKNPSISPFDKNKSCLADDTKFGKVPLCASPNEWRADKGVLFATIRSFKGLEADAIIVTDVPNPETTKYFSVSDFYVGCSRAKHLLVVLTTESGVIS